MSKNVNKTILITGATDGIGLALAQHYAASGHTLVLVGRRETGPAMGVPVIYCQADLVRKDAVDRVTAVLQQHNISRLDLVIQNAGVGYYGRFLDQTTGSIDELVNVNLRAPIALTHALLPMLLASRGQLVFISSVVSALPGPAYTVYTATKAALDGFARSLRVELGNQIRVQTIFPGATRTGMHAKMGVSRSDMNWEKFPSASATAIRIANIIATNKTTATIGLGNGYLRFAGLQMGWLVDRWMGRGKQRARAPRSSGICAITGAADGIGKALARRFGLAGYEIVGLDVDGAKAEETAQELHQEGIDISFVIVDLGSREGVETAVSHLLAGANIDVFIHNAGISAVGAFARIPWPRQVAVLDVNFLAPLHLTHRLLQAGKLVPGGHWVFVSSLSHYMSYPGAAVYAASKDGLASLARSLRVASYIPQTATTIYPGPVRTAHARRYSPDNHREGRRMAPEELAEAIFRAVQHRDPILLPGVGPKLLAFIGRSMPSLAEWLMKKTIFEKVGDDILTGIEGLPPANQK